MGRNLCVYLTLANIAATTTKQQPEDRKKEDNKELARDCIFVPLGFETFGPCGPEAERLIQALGEKMTGKTEARSTEFLLQRFTIAIQKYKTIFVLRTPQLL